MSAATSGPEQALAAADLSQLVAVAMRLAMEVSALRERLATHEALLARHGLLDAAVVDAYQPDAVESAARSAAARALIEALATDIGGATVSGRANR
jgi:hypothetical protein